MAKTIVDIDPGRCVCCYACVVACQDQHYDVDETGPALRKAVRRETEDGHISCGAWGCMHCADAPCMAVCPVGAIRRDAETQLVLVDQETCIGCRRCRKACPFDAPQFTPRRKMVKCDGCLSHIRQGLPPVCVKTCPSGALFLREQTEEATAENLRRRLPGGPDCR